MKTEDSGRAARSVYHPTRLSQDREDVVQLNIFQGGRPNATVFRPGWGEDIRIDLERGSRREDEGPLEDVLQLADVAGPLVRHKPLLGGGVDPVNTAADPRRELVEEILRQEGNILRSFTERRELNREHAEPVVEVFAERFLVDSLFQVAVRGGDDPDVDLPWGIAADSVELVFLQDAEELGLGLQRQLTDLVEKQCTAVRELEAAYASSDRAGERALSRDRTARSRPGP